jgi:hypothetical protein
MNNLTMALFIFFYKKSNKEINEKQTKNTFILITDFLKKDSFLKL